MRILVEEHKYKASDIKDVLKGIDALENIEGYVSLNYVGYYYNSHLQDCVFILPKVVLEDRLIDDTLKSEELVFGEHRPEDIINLSANNPLSDKQRQFIYEFSVWIYRAIVVYKNDKGKKTGIVFHNKIAQVGRSKKRLSNTFLDILLSLAQFNKDNQNFFFYVLKNIHSGYNKINWTRTISTSNAIIQDKIPVYLNPVNKKRKINFDEELLVIFFSILNYIGDHYGFPKNINCNFDLITGKRFEAYLNGFGKTRLIQIKYKYFSDKALELWGLCYAFFDNAKQIAIHAEQREYLLVKNFNIVFEAIIDELIGSKDIPDGLKEQEDGKRVDHMYAYQGLTTHEEDKPVYYIGDSKYYKRNNPVGKESVYKQFTYARNVIQWNLNLFMNGDDSDIELKTDKARFSRVSKLRDDLTEGYNIIPNFFISAKLNEDLNYAEGVTLTDKKETFFCNRHFENRLYDRDTLLICHYDVNFLYVVALYARNNASQIMQWKEKVRGIFRNKIQEIIEANFDFYAMYAREGVDSRRVIEDNFKNVIGKVYRPYNDVDMVSLALDKKDPNKNNASIIAMLQRYFFVAKLNSMGEEPSPTIEELKQIDSRQFVPDGEMNNIVLVGYLRYESWTMKYGYYTIRRVNGLLSKPGEVPPSRKAINVKHVLLYGKDEKAIGLFDIKDPDSIPSYTDSQELSLQYSLLKDTYSSKEYYFLYELKVDSQSAIGLSLDILNDFLSKKKTELASKAPFFVSLKEIVKQ